MYVIRLFNIQYLLKSIIFISIILILTSCSTMDPKTRIAQNSKEALVLENKPEENVNNFTEVLQCVGREVALFGTKKFIVGSDIIRNETPNKNLPRSARTMLQSAFATLMEYSNEKIVWLGYSRNNASVIEDNLILEHGNNLKRQAMNYIINGAITQFDKKLQSAQRDANIKLGIGEFDGGAGYSDGASFSVMATDLTLHDLKNSNLALYKGIKANNVISIQETDSAQNLLLGVVSVGGFGFNVGINRKESVSSALMNLMQISAIEITGQYYKDDFNYKDCLDKTKRKKISFTPHFKENNKIYEKTDIKLNIKLNKNTFKPHERMFFQLTPSVNGYLYIFYESSKDGFVRVFPNRYEANALIDALSTITIPNHPKVILTTEGSNIKENIYFLLSRYDLSGALRGFVSNISTKKISMKDIAKEISTSNLVYKKDYIIKTIHINKEERR